MLSARILPCVSSQPFVHILDTLYKICGYSSIVKFIIGMNHYTGKSTKSRSCVTSNALASLNATD